ACSPPHRAVWPSVPSRTTAPFSPPRRSCRAATSTTTANAAGGAARAGTARSGTPACRSVPGTTSSTTSVPGWFSSPRTATCGTSRRTRRRSACATPPPIWPRTAPPSPPPGPPEHAAAGPGPAWCSSTSPPAAGPRWLQVPTRTTGPRPPSPATAAGPPRPGRRRRHRRPRATPSPRPRRPPTTLAPGADTHDRTAPAFSRDGRWLALTRTTTSTPTDTSYSFLEIWPLTDGDPVTVDLGDLTASEYTWTDAGTLLVAGDLHSSGAILAVAPDGTVRTLARDAVYSALAVSGTAVFALGSDIATPPRPVRIEPENGLDLPAPGQVASLPGTLERVETEVDGATVGAWLCRPTG